MRWKSFSFVGLKFSFLTNKNWQAQKILLVFDKYECFVEIPPESEQKLYISAIHWTYTFGRSSKWVFTKYKILPKKSKTGSLPFGLKISILVNLFLPLSPSMPLTRIYSPFFSLFSTRVHICVPSLFTLHYPKVRILSIFKMNVLYRKLKYTDSLWVGNWFEVELKNTKQILNI